LPQPILLESRRRSIQRFLLLPQLSVKCLWFPLLKHWVKISKLTKSKRLTFAIDRTQWRDQNVFVVSLIEDKRAIPVYWLSLPKRGSSNLREQKALLRPVLQLFKEYRILVGSLWIPGIYLRRHSNRDGKRVLPRFLAL
jgi:hypothetical protein